MPTFSYQAVDRRNVLHQGTQDADGPEAVSTILRRKGLTPTRIAPNSISERVRLALASDITGSRDLNGSDLAVLTSIWSGLIGAGLPIEEALSLSLASLKTDAKRAVVRDMREAVRSGISLPEAMARFPKSFDRSIRLVVDAASKAGALPYALEQIADQLESRRALSGELRGALVYPAFLVVAGIGAILTLILVVVPNLELLVGEREALRLPAVTQWLIGLSRMLRSHGITLATVAAVGSVSIWIFLRTARGRSLVERAGFSAPLVGELMRSAASANFCRTLGVLLDGGVVIASALPLAIEAQTFLTTRTGLRPAVDKILAGKGLAEALRDCRALPDDVLALIKAGERSGRLAQALKSAARFHEAKAKTGVKVVLDLIAPVLTVVLGTAAGLIVYAMLTTILSINEIVGS